MTAPLVVDTNALIALFDGNKAIAERLFRAGRIIVPAVVCGEMDVGTRGNTRRESLVRAAFDKFLSLPRVEIGPVVRNTGPFYATVYNFCRAQGRPIPTNDLWIAATALETGEVVLTSDVHLLQLPLLRAESV